MQAKFNDWHLEQQAEIKRLLNKPQQGFVQMLDSANRQCTHPLALQADKQGFTSSAADGASVVSNLFAQNAYGNFASFSNTAAASSILEGLPVAQIVALKGGQYIIKNGLKFVPLVGAAVSTGLAAYDIVNSKDYSTSNIVGSVVKNFIPLADIASDVYSGYQKPSDKMDINPEAGKPKVLSTPLPKISKPKVPDTRAEQERWRDLSLLPGFEVPEIKNYEIPNTLAEKERWQKLQSASNKEGFDLHQTDWRDLILYSDSSGFDPSKEGNHGKVKLSFQYGKIYQDAKDPKTWYSKERSGDRAHGGEHWKRFKQERSKLILDAAVDLDGKVMNRKVGHLVININDLKGIK